MDDGQQRAKFTLYVNPQTRATMERLRDSMNAASISETIRRSVELADWAMRAQSSGGRMFAEDAEGRVEVVRV